MWEEKAEDEKGSKQLSPPEIGEEFC